jgi:hypothetical protein
MTIGYKAAFNYRCLNQRYAVGETYKMDEKPIICKKGFHYCTILNNVFLFYPMSWKTNVFEIEDLSEDTVTDGRLTMFTALRGIKNEFHDIKSATNNIKIVREIHDSEIVEAIGLEHFWEKRNVPFYDEVSILTYKSVGGYWITKAYYKDKDPIFYVDSFGFMATYTDVWDQNIAKEVINEKLKILYKNKTLGQVFDETYRTGSLIKKNHDFDFFKNGFQKEMFKTFGIK